MMGVDETLEKGILVGVFNILLECLFHLATQLVS